MNKIIRSLLVTLLFFPVFFIAGSSQANAAISCQFTANQKQLSLCIGGFSTRDELVNSTYAINSKVGLNQVLFQPASPFFTNPDNTGGIGQNPDGTYYGCLNYDFVNVVDEYTRTYVDPSNAGCVAGWALTNTAAAAATGGLSLAISVGASTAAAGVCTSSVGAQNAGMIMETWIQSNGRDVCYNSTHIDVNVINANNNNPNFKPFALCDQINDTIQKDKCKACLGPEDSEVDGIWTSLGCIKPDAGSIVARIMQIGLSLAGGVALLMILAAAFLFSTSQGDPKRTTEAKELLTSAVIGLLFIVFSVTILQFVGVSILRIPDFGI